MGSKPTKVFSPQFNKHEWQLTDRELNQNEIKGDYKIYRNIRNNEMIDEYELLWPTEQDFDFYLDSYNWRRSEPYIVNSRYIVQQEYNDKFCSKTYGAKVYIEHIPSRLSDVKDIPYPDNLYVIMSALEGYQKLYTNLSYFKVQEDQICVDQEGLVKIWVNSDLSKNYPESGNYMDQHNKDESSMVEEIMNIIWQNTDTDSESASFSQFYKRRKGRRGIRFDEAKVIVNEYARYIAKQLFRQQHCDIPNKFESILQMRQDSDYQQTQNDFEEPHQTNQSVEPFNDNSQSAYNHNQSHVSPSHPGNIPLQQQRQVYGQYVDTENTVSNRQASVVNHNQFNSSQASIIPMNSVSMSPSPVYHPSPHHQQQFVIPSDQISPVAGHYQYGQAPSHQMLMTLGAQPYQQSPIIYNNSQQIQYQQQPLPQIQPQNRQTPSSSNYHHQNQDNNRSEVEIEYNQQSQSVVESDHENIRHQQQPQPQHNSSTNSPINRSMQFMNNSEHNPNRVVQHDLRVNKSHIEQYQFHSRSSAQQSRMASKSQQEAGSFDQQQYNQQQHNRFDRHGYNNIQGDTKYYTLYKEIDLDSEIAADLKRFIKT